MIVTEIDRPVAPDRTPSFLAGGGEMGALIRRIDWSRTPIGPVETWSPTLRAMVSLLLANRFPLLLWWGPHYVQIYNDAYRPIPGTKHPRSMGQPASECWPELWHILKPLIDTPFTGGPATWIEDFPLEPNRHGFVEETHFTVAYSPVPDETAPGGIGGVLATVHEITQKVIGERRVVILRDLGARAGDAKSAEDACGATAAVLADHAKDVPFALLYLIDSETGEAKLAASAGIPFGEPVSPQAVSIDGTGASQAAWPFAEALRRRDIVLVDNLAAHFDRVPAGPWSDPPHSAVVIPVKSNKADEFAGLIVAGVSPRLKLDDLYRSFFELMATQIAASIANARAHEEERKRAEALAEIDRAKTAFFSNVSHEFRTPLTLMLGPLEEMLGAPSEILPQRRDDLVLMHRSGLRLLRLVNTLLDFSRIEAGRLQASYEPVDLAAMTADLASEFRAAFEKAGLRLTVDCPQLSQRVWVDREMWEKIVLNLVSNAFKFTLEGGVTVRVHEQDGNAELTVEDSGTGIPADELPQIFDRFHRVERARGRAHEGTGIGLALVQELAKLHGGAVRVDSTSGAGSTFTVTVPLGSGHLPAERLCAKRTAVSTALGAQPYVEEAMRWLPGGDAQETGLERELLPELPLPADGMEAESSQKALVLLADDNADMRDYLRRLLQQHYDVRAVPDGREALKAIRQHRPDLVLSDVMMPGLGGFGLLHELRADPALADIPVVLLSARADEGASIAGLEDGADDYLVKPFSARQLMARVAANVKMAKLRRGLERRIATDLAAMTVLREVGSQCVRGGDDLDKCLHSIIDAAIVITGADKANLQLLDPDSNSLSIAAQREFDQPFLRLFARVDDQSSACAAALQCGERVIVEDVTKSEIFSDAASARAMLEAGVRAVVSTPLTSSKGALMGILSVHFGTPRRPGERELHFMDLLARQAADYLERREAGLTEQILIRELQHRSNNLLTVIQAIANGTLSRGESLAEARSAFEERLRALARANRQLTNSNWTGVNLADIVGVELQPFAEQTRVEGGYVVLSPQAAQNFSLALHELVTNAAKYGALSRKTGRVEISWDVARSDGGRILNFRWREVGGPPPARPARTGFGTSLLKAVCPGIQIAYAGTGLVCEFSMALPEAAGVAGEFAPQPVVNGAKPLELH